MKRNKSFLKDNQKAHFFTKDQEINWDKVIRRTLEGDEFRNKFNTTGKVKMDDLFDRLQKQHDPFKCYCIEVKEQDGPSWAAEILRVSAGKAMEKGGAPLEIITASNKFRIGLPLIAQMIGEAAFLKIAVRTKVTRDFFSFGLWPSVIIWLAPFVSSVVAGAISNDFSTSGFSAMLSLKYLLIISLTVILCLSGRMILRKREMDAKSEDINGLINVLDRYQKTADGIDETDDKTNIENLIDHSARFLIGIKPKLVIIDEYENIDYFTKRVIDAYFRMYKDPRFATQGAKERWVIFEGPSNERFSLNQLATIGKHGTAFEDLSLLALKPLTDEEKKAFPPENSKFTNIKAISGNPNGLKWVKDNLLEYRKIHQPNGEFGKLDLLYLLSITSTPGHIVFSEKEFDTIFVNDKARSELLKAYMYNKDFAKNNIRNVKKALVEDVHLKDMIEYAPGDSTNTRFNITYEASIVINQDSIYYKGKSDDDFFNKLRLPEQQLGHAFWAVYWYDRLQNHPHEAAWFKRLSYHLSSFDFETIRARYTLRSKRFSKEDILQYILDSYISTINGCVRTAAFEDIVRIIESAVSSVEEMFRNIQPGKSPVEKTLQQRSERLLSVCWDAYVCLKDPAILSEIRRLNECCQDIPAGNKNPYADFYHIYFGFIRKHSKIYVTNPSWYSIPSTTGRRIEEHIILSSTLTCLYLRPVVTYSELLPLHTVCNNGYKLIDGIIEGIEKRLLGTDADKANMVDFINLSDCIWSLALGTHPGTSKQYSGGADYFSNLHKIVGILSYIHTTKLQASRDNIKNEFLYTALLTQIAGVSMAACVVFYRFNALGDEAKEEFKDRINDLIQVINDMFDLRFNLVSTPVDLLSGKYLDKIVAFLQSCSAIWVKMQYNHLYDSLNSKIFYLKAICQLENFNAIAATINNGFHVIGHNTDHSGILSNIIKANILANIHDAYSFIYFNNLYKCIIGQYYSKDIINELFFIKLTYPGNTNMEFSAAEKAVLMSKDPLVNPVADAFKRLPDDSLGGFFLKLEATGIQVNDSNVTDCIYSLFKDRIEDIQDKDLKFFLDGMIRFFVLEKKLNVSEEIKDVDSILKEWQPYRTFWYYASLMNVCLKRHKNSEALIAECLLTVDRNAADDYISSYFNLAYTLCSTLYQDKDVQKIKIPLRYLEAGIAEFETINAAEMNMNTYRILSVYGKNKQSGYYSDKYVFWKELLAQETAAVFKYQLEHGNYFIAFCSLAESVLKESNGNVNEYYASSAGETNVEIHEPFVREGKKLRISKSFLDQGKAIFFNDKNLNNPSFEGQRSLINELAQANINSLFEFVLTLNISPVFNDLVRHYNNINNEFTMPADEE